MCQLMIQPLLHVTFGSPTSPWNVISIALEPQLHSSISSPFCFYETEGAQHREYPPQMIVTSASLIGTH